MNLKATASSSEKRARGFTPPVNDEERVLTKHIADLARAALYGAPRVTGFLSDREQELAAAAYAKSGAAGVFFGGYEGAERKMLLLAAAQPQAPQFAIECLTIAAPHQERALTHRDYLGAVLSLGLRREAVGDVLVGPQGARVYCTPAAAALIERELASVGRCAVQVLRGEAQAPQDGPAQPEEQTVTVPSLRLDAVLAAMLRVSRADAAGLIKSGVVSVNHIETARVHYEVYESDTIRVRGYGKFKVCRVGAQSKKGRTFLTVCRY